MASRTQGLRGNSAISNVRATREPINDRGYAGARGFRSAGFGTLAGGGTDDVVRQSPAAEGGVAPTQSLGVDIPRPPSTQRSLLAQAGARAGTELLKRGVRGLQLNEGQRELDSFMEGLPGAMRRGAGLPDPTPVEDFGGATESGESLDAAFGDSAVDGAGDFGGAIESGYGAGESIDAAFGEAGDYAGDAFGGAIDAGYGAGEAIDAAFGEGADAAGLADFTGGVPVVGPLMRLAQGDVGGAAGSAVGGAIGSAILPGIGTAIGSFIGGSLGGGCFITEAVMAAGGADDNAEELQVLRAFRDNVLMATPQGQAMVEEYYNLAPAIVDAIGNRPDGMQIFQWIYTQFIAPAVEMVRAGNMKGALEIYSQMIGAVTPFATEMMEMEGGGDMMDEMGSHAAMMAHDDMTGADVTGGMGVGNADWTPAEGQDPTGMMMQPGMGGMGAMLPEQMTGYGDLQPSSPASGGGMGMGSEMGMMGGGTGGGMPMRQQRPAIGAIRARR